MSIFGLEILLLLIFTLNAAGPANLETGEIPIPRTVEELYADFDPRREPLDVRIVREWREGELVLRHVTYSAGTFKGKRATMAAYYGFPAGGTGLPALLHLHGGGQRAFLNEVRRFARRGYACLSINWGGRPLERMEPGDPNTDWGAVDPTQNHVAGYSSLRPGPDTLDAFESPRNNNWYLLNLGARRGITFLERQKEVDPQRIGVYGHSMGGRLTGLVAGSDGRVRASSPSVGGSGFLQQDLWDLPGSARRVSGDLELFRQTIAGQAYLQRVHCPILFLSATNDFNAPMDHVIRGMALVPHQEKRLVFAPHLNHRFTPETEIARPLWFDAHLQKRLVFPDPPRSELVLRREDGIPLLRIWPGGSRSVDRVYVYYGYERDPRNRFWADAVAEKRGDVWEGRCPVFDLHEPLFAFANIYYCLRPGEGREGDPETFALSTYQAAYPEDLLAAGVQATEKPRRLIDDFSRDFHDWYVLEGRNRHHWFFATRKLADPRWSGPRGGKLSFEIETTAPENVLAVQITTDSWRSYARKKERTYLARVPLNVGKQRIELSPDDFSTLEGLKLGDWAGITELAFLAADKAWKEDPMLHPWKGDIPRFHELRWVGGELIRRPKAFLPFPEESQR